METGTRVGAILGSEDGIVSFLGYGVYVGDHLPPVPMGLTRSIIGDSWEGIADQLRETVIPVGDEIAEAFETLSDEDLLTKLWKNPKIELDNGDVVWGAECWWGPEDKIDEQLDLAKEVRAVRIADSRALAGYE